MTKTFAVNDNNDLYIGVDGNLVINTGILAIRDACANAVKTELVEMVLQTNQGIPNFQAIFSGSQNLVQYEAALRSAINSVDGVLRVVNLSLSINDGTLNYIAVILTNSGETVLQGFLNGRNI